MWIGIVSLFPGMFQAITDYGITRRAVENGLLEVETWNPRDFAEDRHRTVDDKPYGGGPGMLMKVQPLADAIAAAKAKGGADCPVVYLSPQGRKLVQSDMAGFAQLPGVIMVAGRYEGVDERLIESVIDDEVSIGDYVVSGGELPAMVLMDGLTRLIPGVVGDRESVEQDSFTDGLLDYPQYTRPEIVDDKQVPEVLMSGDHKMIERWRRMQALGRTAERRPDLLGERQLSDDEQRLLDEYRNSSK